ncbi:MAG TPA: type VI secretion system baseplate subunit TssF, partial [Pirellulales bacterium]|nr:type VI secretion system baseplate subunit TssF [Pirellulales bacterium]
FPYYERELTFIRHFAQDFARQYPAAAGRLLLEPNRSLDPHVERLIESFALLAARIQYKLDDDFPELTAALLSTLYPHYLAPIPSLAMIQLVPDFEQSSLESGFELPKHTRLRTPPVNNVRCQFRTCYPVKLWPIELSGAALQSAPFPPGFNPPAGAVAALRMELACHEPMHFQTLGDQRLRLHLWGDNQLVGTLYELLFNHALQVVFRPLGDGGKRPPVVLDPEDCLEQVGFGLDEGLLPYPRRSFAGYRLLTEFFSFPSKFQFVDLGGWQRLGPDFPDKLEVVVYLNRTVASVERGVNASTFRLGCTPVINLFEQTAEPIALRHSRYEYRVLPDVAAPAGFEVYSIDEVVSSDPVTFETTEYAPFYGVRHGSGDPDASADRFWYSSRRTSEAQGDRSTDVYLSFVNRKFNPALPADPTVIVRTTCTNRNLPNQLQQAGDRLYFELDTSAPVASIRCLRTPTSPLRPPMRRGAQWNLISHLSLNYLSLADSPEGRESLQQILQIYSFADPESGQMQMAEVTRQMIDGIAAVSSRRVIARVAGAANGFCHGMETTIEFDEQRYVGNGAFLFACVLEQFLGLYASINSFS